MLTLTRRAGEAIVIGDTVRVTVKEIKGRNVRLMIAAPKGVSIFREEVFKAIEAENRAAAAARGPLPGNLSRPSIRLAGPQEEKGEP